MQSEIVKKGKSYIWTKCKAPECSYFRYVLKPKSRPFENPLCRSCAKKGNKNRGSGDSLKAGYRCRLKDGRILVRLPNGKMKSEHLLPGPPRNPGLRSPRCPTCQRTQSVPTVFAQEPDFLWLKAPCSQCAPHQTHRDRIKLQAAEHYDLINKVITINGTLKSTILVEQELQRPLLQSERIEFKDQDPANLWLGNIQLVSISDHRPQPPRSFFSKIYAICFQCQNQYATDIFDRTIKGPNIKGPNIAIPCPNCLRRLLIGELRINQETGLLEVYDSKWLHARIAAIQTFLGTKIDPYIVESSPYRQPKRRGRPQLIKYPDPQ